MPELAEVETIRRGLSDSVVGERFTHVETDGNARFEDAVLSLGKEIVEVNRRGKYLLVNLGNSEEMIIHLGMTGALLLDSNASRFRVRWRIGSKALTLTDPRGFGKVGFVSEKDYSAFPGLQALGPEPLEDADEESFVNAFKREGGTVKARLLGQKHLAGVGNYVCDEALWRAKIHPARRSLKPAESSRLLKALVAVFTEGIERGGMSIRDYQKIDGSRGEMSEHLNCYGRAGLPCLRCQSTLQKSVVAGRGSTWCPRCQREPRK